MLGESSSQKKVLPEKGLGKAVHIRVALIKEIRALWLELVHKVEQGQSEKKVQGEAKANTGLTPKSRNQSVSPCSTNTMI